MSQVLLYESGAVIQVGCCYTSQVLLYESGAVMSQVLLYESGSVYVTDRIVST